MKKILSILCVLSLIMGIAIVPAAFVASAEGTVNLVPSAMLNVTSTTENDVTSYNYKGWGKTSLTFDYVIESGYNYILEFDYIKNKNMNVAEYTTRISAKTVASKDDVLTEIGTQFVTLSMQKSTEWKNDYQIFLNGDDLLESGGAYLMIFSKDLEYDASFRNFSITKVEETTDYIYPQNIHYEVTPSVVDGEAVYTSGTWDEGSLTFDYVIEAGCNYFLEFDYKGSDKPLSGTGNRLPAAYTVDSPNKYYKYDPNFSSEINLYLPSSKNTWTPWYAFLSGDELLACGGTYFSIMWRGLDPASHFKNFKITKLDAKSDENAVEPLRCKNLSCTIENGEHIFSCTNYDVNSIVFNKIIEADKKYVIVYDYVMNTTQFDNQAPSATTVTSKDVLPNHGIVDGAVNIGIPKTGNAPSPDWKTMATILDGNEVRSATGGDYLALHWVYMNQNQGSGYFKIKNVRVYDYDATELNFSKLNRVNYDYDKDGMIFNAPSVYDAHCITFDYEIEADKKYYLSFDYKGNGQNTYKGGSSGFAGQAPVAGTIADKTKYYNDKVEGGILLNVPDSRSGYTSVVAKLDGNNLLAIGGKYLTISWMWTVDMNPISFRNVCITEVADDDMDVPVTVNNMLKSVDNGAIVYTNKDYSTHSLTFDKKAESNKVYQVNFEYMGHDVSDAKNIDGEKCVPALTAVASAETKVDSSKYSAIKLGITSHKSEWKKYSPIVRGDSLLATGGEYISIHFMYMGGKGIANFKNIDINAFDYGDVDFDGIVNGTDVTVLKKVLLGVEQETAKYTNVNADADEITNILDLVAIKKAVAE